MWIGLTGKNGAGKGLVADYLKTKGFAYHSLSDVIRDEIRQRGQAVTRERLIATGRELRQKNGPSALADLILHRVDAQSQVIIDSIRNPYEVEALRQHDGFVLLAVDAEQNLRFHRCKERGRENDPKDLAEFIRLENEELHNTDPTAQQLLATVALANFVVMNNTSKEDCWQQVDAILTRIA